MKKYVTKAAVAGVLSLLVSTTMAQEKNEKPLKEGEVKVMIVKDENGKVSEINETFSLEDREKVNALLEKEGVKWNLDELEKEALKSGERITVEMEVEEEEGDNSKRDIRIIRMDKGDESPEDMKIEDFENAEGHRVIKLKQGDGSEKVMVIKGDGSSEGEMTFTTEDGEEIHLNDFDLDIEFDGDGEKKVYKTMVFVTSKSGELDQDMLDELPTEIEESKLSNMPVQDLKLYPNPSNGNFSMKFKTEKPTDLKLSITDVKGAKVYQKELTQFEGTFQEDYDLSDQESGVYFFNIDAEGERSSHRVLVQ